DLARRTPMYPHWPARLPADPSFAFCCSYRNPPWPFLTWRRGTVPSSRQCEKQRLAPPWFTRELAREATTLSCHATRRGTGYDEVSRIDHGTGSRDARFPNAPITRYQISPPLTPITCPVTHRASSEARNATTSAMSSGVPRRRRAVISIITRCCSGGMTSRSISVSVGPGATALTVMLRGPSSAAWLRVMAWTAALVAL